MLLNSICMQFVDGVVKQMEELIDFDYTNNQDKRFTDLQCYFMSVIMTHYGATQKWFLS